MQDHPIPALTHLASGLELGGLAYLKTLEHKRSPLHKRVAHASILCQLEHKRKNASTNVEACMVITSIGTGVCREKGKMMPVTILLWPLGRYGIAHLYF